MFGTVASRFNDDGVTALYQFLRDARVRVSSRSGVLARGRRAYLHPRRRPSSRRTATATWPTSPARVRAYHEATADEAEAARRRQQLRRRRSSRSTTTTGPAAAAEVEDQADTGASCTAGQPGAARGLAGPVELVPR